MLTSTTSRPAPMPPAVPRQRAQVVVTSDTPPRPVPVAEPPPVPGDPVEFRQLRCQTRQALQKILSQVWLLAEERDTPAARRLVAEAQRRIALSAALSDALFGVLRAPGTTAEQLRAICERTLEARADPDQVIQLTVWAEPAPAVAGCPAGARGLLMRIAHELVAHAVRRGLYGRMIGRITVRLVQPAPDRLRLTVTDDGWGPLIEDGEELAIARDLALQAGATLGVGRRGDLTSVEVELRAAPVGEGAANPASRPTVPPAIATPVPAP